MIFYYNIEMRIKKTYPAIISNNIEGFSSSINRTAHPPHNDRRGNAPPGIPCFAAE